MRMINNAVTIMPRTCLDQIDAKFIVICIEPLICGSFEVWLGKGMLDQAKVDFGTV